VDHAAGGDSGLQHLLCRVATRVAQHDGDRTAQDHVDAAPDLPAGRVVVDVLRQLVALGQDLPDGGRADGQDRRSDLVRVLALADLGHPSSLKAGLARARPTDRGRQLIA
jgi:hypothetical protein